MPIPGLQKSPRSKVFRAIVKILEHDRVLSNVIKPEAFRSWSGGSKENLEFTFALAPALRLTPANTEEHFWAPNAMVGQLFINCEMLVAGTNVDDVNDLWYAIERAIYPTNNMQANIPTLQAAGAHSGIVLFSQPAYDPEPQDKFFAAIGQMKVDVRINVN
jgi:hypothetical protein